MKKVVIAVDTFGWCFDNIAKQIAKTYGHQYEIEIIDRPAKLGSIECDVLLLMWWKVLLGDLSHVRAKRICVGMYDHWSVPALPQEFAKIVPLVDCFFAGNEVIQADLRLRAPGKQVELTEDGVDLDLFTPQPFPETFTIGWCGNRIYEKIGLGDLKGVRLIEEACRIAGVPLVIQDKQVRQLKQEEMPEQFYRKISCYCCASITEGTPNPVLEALACGRPVVSTRVGVIPKLIDGYSGSIVDRYADSIFHGIQLVRRRWLALQQTMPCIDIGQWDWKLKAQAFQPVLEGG